MKLSRSQLSEKYNIDRNTWTRRHDDVLDYLKEYMDIEEEVSDKGRYSYIITGDIPDKIPPIPRKSNKKEKQKDYYDYTIASLSIDFKPNSKAKVARDAINDFSLEKYGHTSIAAVVRRYVGPVMEEAGEHSDYMIWVDYITYEPINDDQIVFLRELFQQEKLTERDMANAFIKEQQGEDITEERSNYKRAISRFKDEFGFIPIRVYEWKLKSNFDKN